jgi:hypothetical protein
MTMIMSGSKNATIQEVQRVSLHGTEFYDVVFCHDDEPGQLRRTRVGTEAIYAQPQAGDPVSVSYLMNVPTNIARRTN